MDKDKTTFQLLNFHLNSLSQSIEFMEIFDIVAHLNTISMKAVIVAIRRSRNYSKNSFSSSMTLR